MKRYLLLSIVVTTLTIITTSATAHGQTLIDTGAATDISVSLDQEKRVAPGNTLNAAREKLRMAEEARKKMASSTHIERKDIRGNLREKVQDVRVDANIRVKNATTSEERWGIKKDARLDMFRARHTAFIKQLELSVRNLEHIATRISDRITKIEQTHKDRDLTEAKSLLVTAQAKIETAQRAIAALKSYTPPKTTDTETAVVDLAKPREIGTTAIEAVKDAREALRAVVRSLAHAMGLKSGKTDTTTP